MKAKVFLKNGRTFDFKEEVILDDKQADRVILSYGKLSENRTSLTGFGVNHYQYVESDYITYSWQDIEKIEVTR